MSSLLKMAKDSEQKLKAQATDTERMLSHAFSEHEKSVSEALNSSEKRISAAIAGHTTTMSEALALHSRNALRMTGRTWLTITLVTVLLTGTCAGVLWYQTRLIAENLNEISRQNEALTALNAKTWGVTYLSDSNGRFLVLPAGTTAAPGWTVGEGKSKQNAVKLVQE